MPCNSIHRLGSTLALFLVSAMGSTATSQAGPADESEIRALMIFNLTKFVDWPATRFEGAHSPFVVCVSGDDVVESQLERLLAGKQVQGRPVIVHRERVEPRAAECEILFLASPRGPHLAESIRQLSKSSVLTVTDQHLGHEGIVVGLPFEDHRIKIEIDAQAATQSRLDVSSRLLGLAEVKRP
jgi:hypothetical protein